MSLVISIILSGLIAMMAIPADVWTTINQNCLDHRSDVRSVYVWRETKAVGNFYAGLFLAALVIAALLIGALLVADSFVIPMSVATDAMREADSDPERWWNNLTTGNNNVNHRFDAWSSEGGATGAETSSAKHLLWYSIPVAVMIGMVCVALFARLTSFGYSMALDELVTGVNERHRSKMVRHYLRTSAQRDHNWNSKSDEPADDLRSKENGSGNHDDTRSGHDDGGDHDEARN